MERKICPHCRKPSYSSLSYTEVWTCAYCGEEFLAVEGQELGRPVPGSLSRLIWSEDGDESERPESHRHGDGQRGA